MDFPSAWYMKDKKASIYEPKKSHVRIKRTVSNVFSSGLQQQRRRRQLRGYESRDKHGPVIGGVVHREEQQKHDG